MDARTGRARTGDRDGGAEGVTSATGETETHGEEADDGTGQTVSE